MASRGGFCDFLPWQWLYKIFHFRNGYRLRSLLGICFCARRTGNGENGDGRRGERGSAQYLGATPHAPCSRRLLWFAVSLGLSMLGQQPH